MNRKSRTSEVLRVLGVVGVCACTLALWLAWPVQRELDEEAVTVRERGRVAQRTASRLDASGATSSARAGLPAPNEAVRRTSIGTQPEVAEETAESPAGRAPQAVEFTSPGGTPLAGIRVWIVDVKPTTKAEGGVEYLDTTDEQGRIELGEWIEDQGSTMGVPLDEKSWVTVRFEIIATQDPSVRIDRAGTRFVDGVARVAVDIGAWRVEFVNEAGTPVSGAGELAWMPPKEWLPSSRADLPTLAPPNSLLGWREVRSGMQLWVDPRLEGSTIWARLPVGRVEQVAPRVGSAEEPSVLQLPIERGDLVLRGSLGEAAAGASVPALWIEGPRLNLNGSGVVVDENGAFELKLQGAHIQHIVAVHLVGIARGGAAFSGKVVLWDPLDPIGEHDLGVFEVQSLPRIVSGRVVDARGKSLAQRSARLLTPDQANGFEPASPEPSVNFRMRMFGDRARIVVSDHLGEPSRRAEFGTRVPQRFYRSGLLLDDSPVVRAGRQAHEPPAYLVSMPSNARGEFSVWGAFDGPLAVVLIDGGEPLEVRVGEAEALLTVRD